MSDPITEAAAILAAHPDPMVRLIAERLAGARVRRRAAGLSQDDVARRIGLLRPQLANAEAQRFGSSRPRRRGSWLRLPGSDRGRSDSTCRCWLPFGILDADREPKRHALPLRYYWRGRTGLRLRCINFYELRGTLGVL